MNKPIYALSGNAEWFWLLAKGWKDIENRPWNLTNKLMVPKELTFPARIYLHASKTPASDQDIDFILDMLTPEQQDEFDSVGWERLRGKIIGEVTITGQVIKSASRWFFGKYGFLVQDPVLYDRDKHTPYSGRLGFFKVIKVILEVK
jgi:hypothetical protein